MCAVGRLYQRGAATYESGSLRRFAEGRTDTIRSCSIESDAYCRAMLSDDVSQQERATLLRAAIAAHRQYSNAVRRVAYVTLCGNTIATSYCTQL